MNEPIYTITTVRHALDAGTRTVGFYHTLMEATETLTRNCCDMNEAGYYIYAVIEKVNPGLYSFPREEIWYEFNHEKEMYKLIPKPERFKKVVCWSMG